MKLLLIKPLDWLAFRNERNFDSLGETKFPSPKTILGALYGEYYRKNIKERDRNELIEEIKGKMSKMGEKLIGPFVFEEKNGENEIYFPMPSILRTQDKKIKKGLIDENYKINYNDLEMDGFRLKNMKDVETPERTYLTLKEMIGFKKDNAFTINDIQNDAEKEKRKELPYKTETKIGIGLEKGQRLAKESMLYSLTYYRFRDNAGLCMFLEEGYDEYFDKIEFIKLGSKGRLAKVEIVEDTNVDKLFEKVDSELKAHVLLTPAYFENGVIPKDTDSLKSIINKKAQKVGFWDTATNTQSDFFQTVPAGSTYVYSDSKELLTDKYQEYGFGKTIEFKIEKITKEEN
jgi:CRISPR-associated protein Cmr3